MSTCKIRTCLSLFLRRITLGAVLGGSLMAGSSLAAETHAVLHADDLDLSVPCAQVRIKVDPNLKDGMALEDTAGLSPVVQTAHDGAESHLRVFLHNCPKGGRMTIRLSRDTTLTLHDSPQAHITINGTLTTLESNLEDTSLQVDRVESLDMSISGTTQARIRQLDRAAQISATGAARLDVDLALLSALSAQLSDNSQLSIAQGQIDSLTLTASHQAEASIMATLNNAGITTNDAAAVLLNKVTGTVQDGGTKHITHATPPQAAATASRTSQDAQPAAQPPKPDGQAQGLNNPAVPHVPRQAPAPVQPVPDSARHMASTAQPPAAPATPAGPGAARGNTGQPAITAPASPAPSATAPTPRQGGQGTSTEGAAQSGKATSQGTAPQPPQQAAHPAATSPAQPPVNLPSQAIPQTTSPQTAPSR